MIHYIDVIMTIMASQITSLTAVYSAVYSDADQRKHQSSASLAFVWGSHRDWWIPHTKGKLREKCFHLMTSSWKTGYFYWPIHLPCLTFLLSVVWIQTWIIPSPYESFVLLYIPGQANSLINIQNSNIFLTEQFNNNHKQFRSYTTPNSF